MIRSVTPMVKFATLVWRNLRRSPRRTILTIMAIALAAFTYSSLSSLPNIMRATLSTPDSARRIVVTSDSGFFNRLPDSYKAKILGAPHVVAASGLVYFGGVYRSPSDQLGIAVDADQAELMWPDWGLTSGTGRRVPRQRDGVSGAPGYDAKIRLARRRADRPQRHDCARRRYPANCRHSGRERAT